MELWALWDGGEQRGVYVRRQDAERDLDVLHAQAEAHLGRSISPTAIGLEVQPLQVLNGPLYATA
jgi:hypothetical protein